jgi:hypothetical protein
LVAGDKTIVVISETLTSTSTSRYTVDTTDSKARIYQNTPTVTGPSHPRQATWMPLDTEEVAITSRHITYNNISTLTHRCNSI